MPYSINKNSSGDWVVRKKKTGKVIGKHASRQKAMTHMRALYANEKKAVVRRVNRTVTDVYSRLHSCCCG